MNRISTIFPVIAFACLSFLWPASGASVSDKDLVIVSPQGATVMETVAAREIRRYVYLRTGLLVPIVEAQDKLPGKAAVVVAQKDRPIVSAVADASARQTLAGLQSQQYLLKTLNPQGRAVVLVSGGDALGTLYGAYRLAERLGVRFYMHGDVIPDERLPLSLPSAAARKGGEMLQPFSERPLRLPPIQEVGKPLFALRGIQPFHDFPEGPDWWNRDDYLAVLSQLPKMRMNFFGLHTYPEGGVGPEPAVWIGTPGDCDSQGRVTFSYPSQWTSTDRKGMWGYQSKLTSQFAFGASQLFERDVAGPD